MTERRRLAAIVAADVVGYSRLMGRDESGTLARLRAHRTERLEPILARRGGRIVKLTGDGALVEFTSAVDAVSAAIEFQQTMTDANTGVPDDTAIVFRIGVHLGDLIVEGDDLYGDGVNVAARLEAEARAGGIIVSGDVHNAVAGRLKATFDDLGELALKNIERPVRAYRATWAAADWPMNAAAVLAEPPTKDEPLALPDKPSIAVLPFTNMSGDPEQEYFTDGVSEDIITELSRFRDLFVIARNSSFSYKGKSPDIRQVGRELGVRYVLEGSIRRAANRVRVTAQLIDSITGSHVWAERYDRVLDDIFAVQEEVTRAIVAAVAPEIAVNEGSRASRHRPGDLTAYEIALRAWADVLDAHETSVSASLDSAIATASRALEIDASSVLAWQSLSFAYSMAVWHGTSADSERCHRAVARALALDGADARSHALRAFAFFLTREHGRHADALAMAAHAQALNANDVFVLYVLANFEASIGDPARAIDLAHQILRLNPRDRRVHMIHTLLAFTHFRERRYADGLACAARALNDAPRNTAAISNRINSLIGLGEIVKARALFDEARKDNPSWGDRVLNGKGSFALQEIRVRQRVFMRIAAGLENPSAAEAVR